MGWMLDMPQFSMASTDSQVTIVYLDPGKMHRSLKHHGDLCLTIRVEGESMTSLDRYVTGVNRVCGQVFSVSF